MTEINDEKYEEPRLILEKQYGQTFMLEEAKEIGDGLIEFYTLLAELAEENGNSQELPVQDLAGLEGDVI